MFIAINDSDLRDINFHETLRGAALIEPALLVGATRCSFCVLKLLLSVTYVLGCSFIIKSSVSLKLKLNETARLMN